MRAIRILLALIILLALAAAGVVYSGAYDVSAANPEPAWRARLFETVKDRSIDRRAAEQQAAAPSLTDPERIRTGVVHFNEMCVTCHGAPGVPKSEIGMGLNPDPPDLAHEGEEQAPGRLFWVLKNGIKMTGMPAFGMTHTDDQIWAMVAFLKQLPKIDAQRYAAMLQEAGVRPAAAEHEHEPAVGPPHPAAPPPPSAQAKPAPLAAPPPSPNPPPPR
jgi:mono/diheme cytochrome c family protein